MRPAASTAVASSSIRLAPDNDRLPICVRCHALADPSMALYWHIGLMTMRFCSLSEPSSRGEKSEAEALIDPVPERVVRMTGTHTWTRRERPRRRHRRSALE
jgi:hypothetical protein